jgi:hypothetical protein
MSIKITIPNSSSDVLTFGSGNTPTAAQIAGIDSGSSNGQLALYTTASGTSTERVRVDASGNVGIGATSSLISGLSIARGSGVNALIEAAGNGNTLGSTSMLYGQDSAQFGYCWNRANAGVLFGTNNTERMRIDSSGNLLVGTTAAITDERLYVRATASTGFAFRFYNTQATAGSTFGQYILYSGSSPNGTGNQFLRCDDSTTTRAEIRSNGGLANYSGNNVNLSDRREKTNFAPAGDYLAKICAIPVQTFNYIDQNMEEDGGLTLGVVAQDVQAVAPEMVMESNWGTEENPKMRLSIYQTDLQYALMKCIQEQQAIITSLTDRITALEGATS